MIPDHDRREHKWTEVGCQWECPEDARREVGCQTDVAETAEAGVQVELWAQQATWERSGGCGLLWTRVSVGEDKPDGGDLEEHSCTHMGHICLPTMPLCPSSHARSAPSGPQVEPCPPRSHRALPSMPVCSIGGTHGSPPPPMSPAVSGTPPGLIAPMSPPLAEEEEEPKLDCSDQQPTLKAGKKKRRSPTANKLTSQDSRRGRRRHDDTHKTTKLLNEDEESQGEGKLPSCGREEEEGREERKDPGEQMEADMLLKQGGVKPVQVEQVGRPQRIMVGPPIRYLLESEESHGLLLASHRENMADLKKKLGKLTRERRTEDRLQQVCQQTFTRQAFRQRRSSIRCHRQANREGRPAAVQCSKEVAAQHKEQRNAEQPLVGESFKAPDWSRQMGKYRSSKRRPDTARRKRRCQENDGGMERNRKSSEETEVKRVCLKEEGEERGSGDGGHQEERGKEVKKHPQRPRRKMVGPPIRYLLESEEPSHGPLTLNRTNHKPNVRQSDSETVGGASETIDRFQAAGTGHMITEEEEELPQRPRRKMVGPPIRYLIESEEPSCSPLTATTTNQDAATIHKQSLRKSNSETVGGASETIDRLQAAGRETGHMITEEEGEKVTQEEGGDKLPQRPRRKMVGPPIRYLIESEEPSHGPLTLNRTNHKPNVRQSDSETVGGASETIDRLQAVGRETGHMITEEVEGDKLPQRMRRKMGGPPIRYLIESEEPSHGPLTLNRTNHDRVYKPGILQSDAAAAGGHRRIYLVYRDHRCGQVTIISPCCVRLQRLV